MPIEGVCPAATFLEVVAVNLPGTLAGVAAVIVALRGKHTLEHVKERTDQLMDGAIADKVVERLRSRKRGEQAH